MAEKEYRKIGGRGRRPGESFTWSTLWLGRDHLLQVEHTGYTEEYKRFYFGDIQSITMRRTKRQRNWAIFFVIVIVALASIALGLTAATTNPDPILSFTLLSFVALFGALLVVNWIKGPTCICHLRTAVQEDQLPSLKRVRKSRRTIARVRELIAEAQSALNPDEARGRFAAGEHLHAPARSVPPPLPPG